jgi:hypothetical protein
MLDIIHLEVDIMKLLDPTEVTKILDESSSLGTNLFQSSREFNIFNTILSESEAYDSKAFNFPVEAVRVWRMKDDKLVSTMEDVMEYMKFNNISNIVDAVHNVCEANKIENLALSLSLEALIEAESRAAKSSKKHKSVAICKGCGKPVTECECKSGNDGPEFAESADTAGVCPSCHKPINECDCKKTKKNESSNPDISMFNDIMGFAEHCIDNNIEIVLKSDNLNESLALMAASLGTSITKSYLIRKARKIVKELKKSNEYKKFEEFNHKFKVGDVSQEVFNFVAFPTIIGTMIVPKADATDAKKYISKLTNDITKKYKGVINKAQFVSQEVGDKAYFAIGLTDKLTSKVADKAKDGKKVFDKANFKL